MRQRLLRRGEGRGTPVPQMGSCIPALRGSTGNGNARPPNKVLALTSTVMRFAGLNASSRVSRSMHSGDTGVLACFRISAHFWGGLCAWRPMKARAFSERTNERSSSLGEPRVCGVSDGGQAAERPKGGWGIDSNRSLGSHCSSARVAAHLADELQLVHVVAARNQGLPPQDLRQDAACAERATGR